MEIPLHREGREQKMVIDMLPFPTLIPVDDNDLKSLALSVDVVDSRTLVAPESAFLIGGDTALTVDVSDLPQRTEGGVTGQTETASRSPTPQDFSDGTRVPKRKPKPEQVGNLEEIVFVHSLLFQIVKTVLFILTILGGVECTRNSSISREVSWLLALVITTLMFIFMFTFVTVQRSADTSFSVLME